MSQFCLNPACKNPHNPDDNQFCHGCNANLAESTQSYLFENYRVTKLLGEGGFGRTYLAEYLRRYNESRLIKTLITSDQKQTQQKVKELFTREAEQLHQLDHPQIPKLYEYFEKDDNLYLVQEFIDGINLREELEQNKPFPAPKIQVILEEILPVLAYIEEKNLLHRDIKPDNIMRRHSDGMLMLIDFGAARVKTGIGPTALTAIYTPGYAAIEHMMGRPVKASDIYSVGVTCIRLLTGCLPNGTTDLIYNDQENCLCWKDYLRENNIEVSERLVAILDKMVASSLKERYPDAQAVLKDLLLPNFPAVPLLTEAENEQNPNSNMFPAFSVSSPILEAEVENGNHSTTPPHFPVPSRTLTAEIENKKLSPVRANFALPPQTVTADNEEDSPTTSDFSDPSSTLVNSVKKFGLLAGAVAILTGVVGVGGYLLINQPKTTDNNIQESVDNNEIIPVLETLEVKYQQGKYQDCYQSAMASSEQDNMVLQEWIGKCGLAAAEIKANANNYSEAIAIAQTIPNTVPNNQRVKDSINIWSGKILEYATQVYQQGKLEEAIKVTDIIPDNSSTKTKIPDLISQWKREKEKQRKQQEQQQKEQQQANQQTSLISKTTGLNYTRISGLLKAGKWQEADKATTKIMLQAVGRQQQGWFRKEDVSRISCEDLRIINQLWLDYSQSKSGFSVQRKIWQKNGSPKNARGKASLNDGKVGKLPSDIWEGQSGMWDVTMVEFFSRVANCNL